MKGLDYYYLIKNGDVNPIHWEAAGLANGQSAMEALHRAFIKMIEDKDVLALDNLLMILLHFANRLGIQNQFEAFGQNVYAWMRNDAAINNREVSVDLLAMAKKCGLISSSSNNDDEPIFREPVNEITYFED